jgi:hypothetical protein
LSFDELLNSFAKRLLKSSAAKPDPFFPVETDFGHKIRVESGRDGPQDQKTGPIGSGWPQIGFRVRFNPIMYLINPNEPDLNPILGRVGPPGSKFGLSRAPWVQIRVESGRVGQVHLAKSDLV